MKKVFNIVFFLLNVALVAALFVSYTAIYINPDLFYIPAFFGLAYPFILLANILLMCWWIFQLHLKFLMSLTAIIAGWSFVERTLQFHAKDNSNDKAVKVMSYNVMNFGFEKNQNSRDDIVTMLAGEQPDILCIQEFYSNNNWPVNMEKKIAEILHTKHFYFNNVNTGNKNYKVGTIIFSKFPIKSSGVVRYNNVSGNSTIYVDVVINGIDVRVFNVHLQSIRFNAKDYELLKEIGQGNGKAMEESKSVIARMKQAYILRAEQAKLVQEAIRKSPAKVLVCGDFNDSPVSFAYQKVSDGLKDAFVESGAGLGRSYANLFPGVRIDYILGSQSFELKSCEVVHKKYSDHFPVKSLVSIK